MSGHSGFSQEGGQSKNIHIYVCSMPVACEISILRTLMLQTFYVAGFLSALI